MGSRGKRDREDFVRNAASGTDSPIDETDCANMNVILNSFANSCYTDSFSAKRHMQLSNARCLKNSLFSYS